MAFGGGFSNIIPNWFWGGSIAAAPQYTTINSGTTVSATNPLSGVTITGCTTSNSLNSGVYLGQSAMSNQAGVGMWVPAGSAQSVQNIKNVTMSTAPVHVILRAQFVQLLHNIEDIGGRKGAYDDLVNDMLDLRKGFTEKRCAVKLTAFLVFLNCNGVDRRNISRLCDAVSGMGIEFDE